MLLQKNVYGKLVAKVNNIDTSGFVLKPNLTQRNQNFKKIPDCSGLIEKQTILPKLLTKNKISSISGLATYAALNEVENKTLVVSNVIKKQIMKQKLVKLKRTSLTIIMINIFLLQNLISLQEKFLMQDQYEQTQYERQILTLKY